MGTEAASPTTRERTLGEVDYPNREVMEAAARFTGSFQRWIAALASDGLTYPRLRVLEELHCRGPAKLKTLADLLGMTARNLTALADGLESDGLARRAAHPTDRRVTLLELTPAGCQAAEEALAPCLARMGQVFDRLSPTERRQLDGILRHLVDAIAEMDCSD